MLDQTKDGFNHETAAMSRIQTTNGDTNMEAICAGLDSVPVATQANQSAAAAENKLDEQLEPLAKELDGQPAQYNQPVQRVVWNEANIDTATEMHAQGKSIESIADALHMSPGNVSPTLTEFPGVAERLAKREEEVARERTEIASATFQNAQEDKDAPAGPLGGMGCLGEMGGLGNIKESPAETDEDDFLEGDEDQDEAAEGGEYDEDGLEEEGSDKPNYRAVLAFVSQTCRRLGVEMLLNGKISSGIQRPATTMAELRKRNKQGRMKREDLRHILKHEAGIQGIKLGSFLNTALTQWGREQAEGRRDAIFNAVNIDRPNPKPGWDNLLRMAALRFEGPPEYGAAAIEQIIWETKRRIWGEEYDFWVEDPHFFLFSSPQQWNGKTRLCREIFGPVRELTRREVKFKDMLDGRWHGLWESHGLIIDEIGLNSKQDRMTLAKLKGIITASEHNQRPNAANRVEQVENRTVLLGTSQYACKELFGEPTGMRRYIEVKLIPGFFYRDNAAVREVTETIDWFEVWRGIDVMDDEPLKLRRQYDYLETLWQQMTPPLERDSFDRWLEDVTQASLMIFRPENQKSERVLFQGVLKHYKSHAKHYSVEELSEREFGQRLAAVTQNISTKRERKPDLREVHHLFDRKDGEKSTTYKYIGLNR